MGTLLDKRIDKQIDDRLAAPGVARQQKRQASETANQKAGVSPYALTAPAATQSAGKRPRILHLVNSFEAGGTERQFVELLKRLNRQRYDVRLAALHKTGAFYEEIAASFPQVPEFPLSSFYNRAAFRQLVRLRQFLLRERIDILHTHGFYDSLFGALAGRLAGVRVIASQRHLQLSERRAHDWGTRAIHRLAHRLVVNSQAIRQAILSRHKIADESKHALAKKLVVIHNGLYTPPELFFSETATKATACPSVATSAVATSAKPTTEQQTAIRSAARQRLCRELNLLPDARLVGMVARLVAVKGHRYFLEAAARVARQDRRVHFVLVGDGALSEEIARQAARLRISDRLHLLGDRRDARQLVAAFDVAVLTSLSEGLPNSVMEAMSAGVPVVATAVGGTTELIRDRQTGYLVPPADAEALVARLLFVLQNGGESQTVAERGRAFINTQFCINRMVEAVERLYEELLGG